MKILHEYIDFPGRSTIKVKLRKMPHFTYPWHFHSEYELLYVIRGKGTRFVADSIEPFESGDLVLVGSHLPHFWKSREAYLSNGTPLTIEYIVIQFPQDFLRELTSGYPEFHPIGELLKQSSRGLRFSPSFTMKISNKITQITKAEGFERFMLLLNILQTMTKSKAYKLLASDLFQGENHDFSGNRMGKILHFLNTNYRNKIALEKVAEIASLHPNAFCRYFKGKTGKSLSQFVNDLRINYACRLIIENQLSVSQICFESGFNNLSNFNRIFRHKIGSTPTQYFHQYKRMT